MSGEYGGWGSISQPSSYNLAWILFAKWERIGSGRRHEEGWPRTFPALFSNIDGELVELVGAYGSGDCLALYQHLAEKHSFLVPEPAQSQAWFVFHVNLAVAEADEPAVHGLLAHTSLPNAALMEWQAFVVLVPQDRS